MKENLQPDPEFVSRLEWQLRSEIRRREQFERRKRFFPRLKGWLALATAALAGVAAATAAQRYQDSGRKELLLAQTRATIEITQARKDLALGYLRDLVEAENSEWSPENDVFCRFEIEQIDRQLRLARLDLEEIERTGREPRGELNAPLAGGRDLVSERLRIREEEIQSRLALVEKERERQAALDEKNAYQEQYLTAEELSLLGERENLQRSLALRQDFLAGRLTGAEAVLQSELTAAQKRLDAVRSKREAVAAEATSMREKRQAGRITLLDLQQVEFQLMQAQTEEKLAELELEYIQRQKGR